MNVEETTALREFFLNARRIKIEEDDRRKIKLLARKNPRVFGIRNIARQMGLSPGYVSNLFSGKTNISLKQLVEVRLLLGSDPSLGFVDNYVARELAAVQLEFGRNSSAQGYSCQDYQI